MSRIARWSLALVIVGILSILAAHWINRPTVWRPFVIVSSDLDPVTIGAGLHQGRNYEVSLEFERRTAGAVGKQLVTPGPQSAVVGQWAVTCRGDQVAAGDVADYIRVKTVKSWRGELFRLVARVPFGVDEAKYWSFGLRGSYLSERVVGGFRLPEEITEPCEFSWTVEQSAKKIRIALRRSEQEWRAHSRQLAFLPVGGALAVLLGSFALLAWSLISRWSFRGEHRSGRR